jgi:FkbM family methyltransferase
VKSFRGIWLPDHEQHLLGWLAKHGIDMDGKPMYQRKKFLIAMKHCTRFGTAVDVGGHCGLLSMQMAKYFKVIHAFEPMAAHRECFTRNMEGADAEVHLHECALGDREGTIGIRTTVGSSGDTSVEGEGDIPLRTLDSFNLQDVGFIKLDCEGTELPALRGGEQTLLRCKPTIMVEQKPGRPTRHGHAQLGAVDYLRSLGYVLAEEHGGDYFLVAGPPMKDAA